MTEQTKTLAEMRQEARAGMLAAQAESAKTETTAPTDSATGPSPDETNGENKQVEGTTEEPKTETSTDQGNGGESKKDFWDQYSDDEARKKAFEETKRHAAELSRKLKELESKTETPKTEIKESQGETKAEEKSETDEVPDVDVFIDQAINLKSGHTEDQLRIAQVNYEVLKYHKEVLTPSIEAEKNAKAALEKASEEVRNQRVYATKMKAKAEANSLYQDDLKEAEAELRALEKAHTDARLDYREAADKLNDVKREEASMRLEGRKLALTAVESLKQKSRESKARTEREAQEKKVKEDSDKAWREEFDKALEANGLKGVSDKHKRLLHDAAYNHVLRLAKAGQVNDSTDLQALLKDSFEPYLELKSSAPVMEDKVDRKRTISEEPGPENRKAKTGEEKPQTLEEWKQAARRGMRTISR